MSTPAASKKKTTTPHRKEKQRVWIANKRAAEKEKLAKQQLVAQLKTDVTNLKKRIARRKKKNDQESLSEIPQIQAQVAQIEEQINELLDEPTMNTYQTPARTSRLQSAPTSALRDANGREATIGFSDPLEVPSSSFTKGTPTSRRTTSPLSSSAVHGVPATPSHGGSGTPGGGQSFMTPMMPSSNSLYGVASTPKNDGRIVPRDVFSTPMDHLVSSSGVPSTVASSSALDTELVRSVQHLPMDERRDYLNGIVKDREKERRHQKSLATTFARHQSLQQAMNQIRCVALKAGSTEVDEVSIV